ncbi:MAG TPA: DUF3035 domain-containing protein [Candidatus Pelagibacter sp.]|jgi:uncharacterized lipoprotein|nr:DUF3035 domain-containing protein [Candidatus Pelagibacter sp.]
MFKKKLIFLIPIIMLITACGSADSIKRGITGAKDYSADEFLVEKKDPLIMPPDYDSLPIPSSKRESLEKTSSFEEKLSNTSSEDVSTSSSSTSTESSILKKIKKN